MKVIDTIARTSLALVVIVLLTVSAFAHDKILLTELVVTPTAGEFIEIYNPGNTTVDLTNYYLTDATSSSNSKYYYNIVLGDGSSHSGFSTDFIVKFPADSTIEPGEFQTISLNGSTNFFAEFGVIPNYELFEDDASPDTIPEMLEAETGSIGASAGLSNSGEVVILFYWDGATDLVTDIDYMVWGDKVEAVDKTGISIDGPDADTDASTYADDTAISSQLAATTHGFGFSNNRSGFGELDQAETGGNGVGGSDETSEDMDSTWIEGFAPTPNEAFYWPRTIAQMEIDQDGDFASDLFDFYVEIVGVVTTGNYQSITSNADFYIQDATGGTDVFYRGFDLTWTVGDSLRIEGFVDGFAGKSEIHPEDNNGAAHITVLATGTTVPAAQAITLADLQDVAGEAIEGSLVRFSDWVWLENESKWPTNFDRNLDITDGTLTATMRYDHDITGDNQPSPGRRFKTTGIGGQFTFSSPADDGYQLLTRFIEDFELNPTESGRVVVTDVPNDEGGWVDVTWARALNDASDIATVDSTVMYVVWEIGADTTVLDTLLADFSAEYSIMHATGSAEGSAEFVVYAYTGTDSFPSLAGEGSSEDNIAPAAPTGLSVVQIDSTVAEVLVSWDANTEPDLGHYHGLRGIASGVYTDTAETIGKTRLFIDTDLVANTTYYYAVEAIDENENASALSAEISILVRIGVVGIEDENLLPDTYGISANYPNPFNPTTEINYQVPENAKVNIVIFNLLGERIATLVDRDLQAGYYTTKWNGRADSGKPLASGLYFYKMVAGDFSKTQKMMFLK